MSVIYYSIKLVSVVVVASSLVFISPGFASSSSDISLNISVSPEPAHIHEPITYTITLTNNGPSDALSISMAHYLSQIVKIVSIESSQGSCNEAGAVNKVSVYCSFQGLINGDRIVVMIMVTCPIEATLSYTAEVTFAGPPDPNFNNNKVTVNTEVKSPKKKI